MPPPDWQKPEGCSCEECPLKEQPFCPNETSTGRRCVWIGESPGGREVLNGKPFSGPTGRELHKATRIAGLNRADALVGNAVACRPLKKMTDSQWVKAIKCCAPYREELLARNDGPILMMGKWALVAVCGLESIEGWYGYPLYYKGRMCMPTHHPTFALMRAPWWQDDFMECLRRFHDILEGVWEDWQDPPIYWREPDDVIVRKLDGIDREIVCFDAENAGDPQFADVVCFGVSDGRTAVSVVWPPSPPVSHAFERVIDEARNLVAHNAQHDLLVLEAVGVSYRKEVIRDTLHLDSVLRPELPHSLGVATARLFRAPRWKSIHKDENRRWDKLLAEVRGNRAKLDELCHYNGLDCYHGANLYRHQVAALSDARPNKAETLRLIEQRAWVALDMRRRGVRVDKQLRAEKLTFFRERKERAAARLHHFHPELNLGKEGITNAVKDLFFEHYGLYPLAFTDSGNPACDAWSLSRWANRYGAGKEPAVMAKLVLRYRTSAHMEGMIESLPLCPDGRLHPAWNPWGTVTDRFSCSKPNMLNLPKHGMNNLRQLIIPDPGNVFVIADYDRVELLVIAILANDEPLLKAFAQGIDVHMANAIDLFGPGATKHHRDLAKRMVFAFNYGSSAETVWRNLVTVFPHLKLEHVSMLRRRWFRCHPAIKTYHDRTLEKAMRERTLSPGVGPRSWEYYTGAVDPNEVYNRPIQGTVAWAINRALCRLHDEGHVIPIYMYDELVLEVPVYRKFAAAEALANAMQEEVVLMGRNHVLTCSPEQGDSWGDPRPLEEECPNYSLCSPLLPYLPPR